MEKCIFCDPLETKDQVIIGTVGQSAGQQIPHLHFHLISRTSDEKISAIKKDLD